MFVSYIGTCCGKGCWLQTIQDELCARWRVLTAVDDILQLLPTRGSLLFVNPVGWEPVVVGD